MDLFDEEIPKRFLNKRHERYCKFKLESPDVDALIRKFCIRNYEQGRRFSVRGAIYFVRYYEWFERKRDFPFRVSDHHSPYIARELVKEFPDIRKLITMCRVEGETEAQEEMERGEDFDPT